MFTANRRASSSSSSGIADFSPVVTGFEKLTSKRKIRAWGVSNFKVSHMEALLRVPRGDRCATNQVLYSLGDRGIERDFRIGAARGCSAAAVALAWTIRNGKIIAIPESGSPAHVKENAVALSLTLTPEELQALDEAHPPLGR
jgi:diketogulonate reductase-like aldo/keto reductase